MAQTWSIPAPGPTTSDLLGHQREIHQGGAVADTDSVAPWSSRPWRRRSQRLLSNPDGSAARTVSIEAVRREELPVGVLQIGVVVGQAVVQPPQLVAVHSALLEEEVVGVVVGSSPARRAAGRGPAPRDQPTHRQYRPVEGRYHLVVAAARGCACSAEGSPAAASATTPMSQAQFSYLISNRIAMSHHGSHTVDHAQPQLGNRTHTRSGWIGFLHHLTGDRGSGRPVLRHTR